MVETLDREDPRRFSGARGYTENAGTYVVRSSGISLLGDQLLMILIMSADVREMPSQMS